jgi:hypothetical protein
LSGSGNSSGDHSNVGPVISTVLEKKGRVFLDEMANYQFLKTVSASWSLLQFPPAGWTTGVRFVAGQNLFIVHNVQTGCGAHPVAYATYTGGVSSGMKLPGRELTLHLRLVPREYVELYLHAPIRVDYMGWRFMKQRGYFYILPLTVPELSVAVRTTP